MASRAEKKAARDLLVKIRERYKAMHDADESNRRKAIEDIKFCTIPGEQWDAVTRRERGDRPCYEFNKIRPTVKRVVNEMRKNSPQGKVLAVEDGDKDTAETMEGLIRNIWNVSDADTVIDYAGEYQVSGGMGAWRIVTKYASDSAFEQDIGIEAIKNPFCLYADNACSDPLKRDARDWILTERIAKEVYEAKYKDYPVISFEENEFDDENWKDDDSVRICEYWYKEPVTKTIYLLQGGQTVDDLTGVDPATVVRKRVVNTHKIMMCIASGEAIIEGPKEWAGSQFPFVMIFGDWLVVDGEIVWSGLVRHAKDAQRSYNFARTAISETIALAPQAKFWATAKQALGLTDSWADSHKKNYPVNIYNADPAAPGPPQRMGGADVPVALIQESQIASEEIKAVTGIYDASLGNQSNETSGRAINARQQQGELATFNYSDNRSKGIRRTYEILIDLVPRIYDTERSIRVLGVDGAEKYKKVNEVQIGPDGRPVVVNDLSRGKYDVTVTVGPSFSTQRQEAAETYTQLMQAIPDAAPLMADLAVKSMDLPYANEVAERLRIMLPPQVQQMIASGKSIPPEAQAAMVQAEQVMAQVQEHGQLIEKAAQELEQSKAEDAISKAELEKMLAEIKTQKAELKAMEASFKAEVAEFRAGVAEQDGQRMQDDMGRREQEMAAGANQQGEQTAVQIVQQALQAVTERMDQVEKSIVDRMAVMQPPQPIIVGGGGGRKVINFTRDAAGRAVGATMEEVEGA